MHLSLMSSIILITVSLFASTLYAFYKRSKKMKMARLANSHTNWEDPKYFGKIMGLFMSGNFFQTFGLALFLAAGTYEFHGANHADFDYGQDPSTAWMLGTPPYETFSWGVEKAIGMQFGVALNVVNGAIWIINASLIFFATRSFKKTFTLELVIQLSFVFLFGTLIDVFKAYAFQPLFHAMNITSQGLDIFVRCLLWIIGAAMTMFGIACLVRSRVAMAPYEALSVILSDWYGVSFSKSRIILESTWAISGALMTYLATHSTADKHGFGDMLKTFSIGTIIFGLTSGIVIGKMEKWLTKTFKMSNFDTSNWTSFAVEEFRVSHHILDELKGRKGFENYSENELREHVVMTIKKTRISHEYHNDIYIPTELGNNEVFVMDKTLRMINHIRVLNKDDSKKHKRIRE